MVYACEKLHLYIYDCEFDIVTDHKAVELIYGNENSSLKRESNAGVRLLPYKFKIKHKPGDGDYSVIMKLYKSLYN